MKVAFWSNVSGKCYNTANIAAISVMNSLLYDDTTLIFENNSGIGNLKDVFLQSTGVSVVRENSGYYPQTGMDLLVRRAKSGICEKGGMIRSIVKLVNGRLLYIPRRYDISNEVFEFELNMVLDMLMPMFESYAGNVFIDTSDNHNASTHSILDMADVVVVSMCQNKQVMDDIFRNYSSVLDKAFFVIGNYEKYSRMDRTAISKRYHIPSERIAVIPYNYRFREALSEGNVISFIEKFINCKKRDDNYYFVSELKNTVCLLKEFCNSVTTVA